MKRMSLILVSLLLVASPLFSREAREPGEKKPLQKIEEVIDFRFILEMGFLAVLDHRVQFGKGNEYFNYVNEGGQDTLNFLPRFAVDLIIKKRHIVSFLYQPLEIESKETLKRDITLGSVTLASGETIKTRYSFPFYRLSYMYDFFEADNLEVALGLGLQIRNATIEFQEVSDTGDDGTTAFRSGNIGPVPLIEFRVRYIFPSGFLLGTEIDGFYAPISVLNGSDNEVTGAILDASIFAGFKIKNMEIYLNLRYLAGGAVGSGDGDTQNPDGYTKNWLHFMTVTLGATYTL